MAKALALDLETSGLPPADGDQNALLWPGIVEIGLAIFDTDDKWEITERMAMVINPDAPMSKRAQEVHRIPEDEWSVAPKFNEVYGQIKDFCSQADALITFNGRNFDTKIISKNCERYGLDPIIERPMKHYDLMLISRDILNIPGKRGIKMPNLDELHTAAFGEPVPNHHRALDDAIATGKCAWWLHHKYEVLVGL